MPGRSVQESTTPAGETSEREYQYQHLYCGGPLYGNLNEHALYEWLSFHFHQFGRRSHFVFDDVGGISPGARSMSLFLDFQDVYK